LIAKLPGIEKIEAGLCLHHERVLTEKTPGQECGRGIFVEQQVYFWPNGEAGNDIEFQLVLLDVAETRVGSGTTTVTRGWKGLAENKEFSCNDRVTRRTIISSNGKVRSVQAPVLEHLSGIAGPEVRMPFPVRTGACRP
jgi:hypothetical protein